MTTKAASQDKPPRKLSTASETAEAEANEQAEAYGSIFSPTPLELDNGDILMIPLHPDYSMLDDEKMEAWDDLMFRVDTVYDRHPDIHVPEQHMENGLTLPASTVRGELMRPYRIEGELVKPSHSVRVVQIALGEIDYKRLKEGGKNASDVWKVWGEQAMRIQERQKSGSQNSGSSVALAPVSAPDR